MSVRIDWLTASDVKLSVAKRGELMADDKMVTSPRALVIDEGYEPIIIEGRSGTLHTMLVKVAQGFTPELHSKLTDLVGKARTAGDRYSNDGEIEALQEALSLALGLLGREDLQA
jgi:hypothetical protein